MQVTSEPEVDSRRSLLRVVQNGEVCTVDAPDALFYVIVNLDPVHLALTCLLCPVDASVTSFARTWKSGHYLHEPFVVMLSLARHCWMRRVGSLRTCDSDRCKLAAVAYIGALAQQARRTFRMRTYARVKEATKSTTHNTQHTAHSTHHTSHSTQHTTKQQNNNGSGHGGCTHHVHGKDGIGQRHFGQCWDPGQ